jgi:hypothetical protein
MLLSLGTRDVKNYTGEIGRSPGWDQERGLLASKTGMSESLVARNWNEVLRLTCHGVKISGA